MLASPANGYMHEVDVYCGRSDGMTAEHGLGYNVVMKLSTPYHGKGHHIFYDNFFKVALHSYEETMKARGGTTADDDQVLYTAQSNVNTPNRRLTCYNLVLL